MTLFCLPYAGGSEAIYYGWKRYIDPTIKVVPIELKGRGKRFGESFYANLQEAVDDILNSIVDEIKSDDYAILGHSMGGVLAYELYYKINEMKIKKPKHIFFSGCRPPNIITKKYNVYNLPEDDFMKKIIDLGGTPDEFFNNKELLDIFIPILRNDFRLLDEYKYEVKSSLIECSVSILNGKQDSIALEELLAWNNLSCMKGNIYNFDGNHFFINNNIKNIAEAINVELSKY